METQTNQPRITFFYCINCFDEASSLPAFDGLAPRVQYVRMACSSQIKDVFLLRAFEAGADGVVISVCSKGACRYTEGNFRAEKRVDRLKQILDDIGIGGDRLRLVNTSLSDSQSLNNAVGSVLTRLDELGENSAFPQGMTDLILEFPVNPGLQNTLEVHLTP